MSGVTGIYSFDESFTKELVEALYFGLVSITDRGEAGAGIAIVNSSSEIKPYKGLGKVDVAIPKEVIKIFGNSFCGIGHDRYAREKYPRIENTQPVKLKTLEHDRYECYIAADSVFIPSFLDKLTQELEEAGYKCETLTGAERIGAVLLMHLKKTNDVEEACSYTIEKLEGGGGYSSTIIINDRNKGLDGMNLIALRDPYGLKPFYCGKKNGTYYFNSETYWLEKLGIEEEEVTRGGGAIVSKDGFKTFQVIVREPKLCNFDPVYFGSPYTRILLPLGPKFYELVKKLKNVNQKFHNQPTYYTIKNCLGLALSEYYPEVGNFVDLFVSSPNSGNGVTEGLGRGYNKPAYLNAVRKASAVGRTFMESDPYWRNIGVDLKFEVNRDILEGKDSGVGEDSIVRGGVGGHKSKSGGLIGQLINVARVKRARMFSSYAPYAFNCLRYWGMEESLAAEGLNGKYVNEANERVGKIFQERFGVVIPVYYQPLQNIYDIFGANFCRGCCDGRFPTIDYSFIPDETKIILEKAGVL